MELSSKGCYSGKKFNFWEAKEEHGVWIWVLFVGCVLREREREREREAVA
jgi:hypothetical protein